jgi:ABC-type ATPase involved in cell division
MADPSKPGPGAMVIVRSLIYFATFYIVTALYLVLGSWLLFGPRPWAMKGLELHGRTCVALPLQVIGKKPGDYREDVTDLLQWVGLGDRMYVNPSVLSGGEKQRAAIARAVIGKPEVLLADEPTGNVDPQMARRLLRLFVELNRLGTSVVIATHDHQLMRQFKAPRIEVHRGHVRII